MKTPAELAVAYWNAKPAARAGIMRRLRRALPSGSDVSEFLSRFHR